MCLPLNVEHFFFTLRASVESKSSWQMRRIKSLDVFQARSLWVGRGVKSVDWVGGGIGRGHGETGNQTFKSTLRRNDFMGEGYRASSVPSPASSLLHVSLFHEISHKSMIFSPLILLPSFLFLLSRYRRLESWHGVAWHGMAWRGMAWLRSFTHSLVVSCYCKMFKP